MPLARYLPGAQPTHPAPAVPAGHRWHTALPAWDSVPAAHGGQDVALVISAKVFGAHGTQADWFCRTLNRPGAHGKQLACPRWSW